MNRLAIVFAFAAAISAPASAGERIQLKPGAPVEIRPDRAYVLIESRAVAPMQLVKRASADQHLVWAAKRDSDLNKAKKTYQREFGAYEKFLNHWNRLSETEKATYVVRPRRPEPVDDLNFYSLPAELKNFVNVVAGQGFATSDGRALTLLQLEPGEYDVYSLSDGKNGGRCLCMGSLGFTAIAGKVVSVGSFTATDDDSREFHFAPAKAGEPVPAEVASSAVQPAKIHAVGRMPNLFGARIARVAALDGLITYRLGVPTGVDGKEPDSFK